MHNPGTWLAFPKTLLNGKQKVALGKCCRLVETSCNYNQASSASGPLELTRHLVLLKTAALRTCSGEGIAEINFDQNGIPEAKFHGKLVNYPHTLEKKKNHINLNDKPRCSSFLMTAGSSIRRTMRNQTPLVKLAVSGRYKE